MEIPILLRCSALGVATGGRSSAGLAALVRAAPRSAGILGSSGVRRAAALALAGELLGDKLPKAPSRLQPPGLVARLIAGGGAGFVLARRLGGDASSSAPVPAALPAVATGAAAAALGAVVGAAWRRRWAAHDRPALPGALAEDALVLGLAALAVG